MNARPVAEQPRRILLATDLSARCDRALDRAASLAGQWQAKLVVLHVVEGFATDIDDAAGLFPSWRRQDAVALAERKLLHDLGPAIHDATVLIEDGEPAEAILRVAAREKCDLILTGIARDELLGRFNLGRTVDRLLHRSSLPFLVVKDRPRAPYRHIVVATDFSDSSRHALETTMRYFPQQRLTLFHAYEAPAFETADYHRDYRRQTERNCEVFLQNVRVASESWQHPHLLIECGAPSRLLRDYVRDKGADLIVLGTHGRSALFEIFIGSVAKQIMNELPCDALLIREPQAARTGA